MEWRAYVMKVGHKAEIKKIIYTLYTNMKVPNK